MSAMAWSEVLDHTLDHTHDHPDTSRTHRRRRDTVTAPVRQIGGTSTPPPPVCDLVDIDPRRRRAVQQWVDRYARTVLEIISGERPPAQVSRWTSLTVHHDLCRRAHLVARATQRPAAPASPGTRTAPRSVPRAVVRSVHVSFLDDHVVEASVHVRQGERSRAFAARFEWRRDRWVCTALDFC